MTAAALVDARVILSVFAVWHPKSSFTRSLAENLFRDLCADPDIPARRGLGIPVWFRTSNSAGTVPREIRFGTAERTVVFVLADDTMVADANWRRYVEALVDKKGETDVVVPVAITRTRNLPPKLGSLQAIALSRLPQVSWPVTLLTQAMHDLCRCLDPDAAKVRVFLSHAKQDGVDITGAVRRYLHETAMLDDFFDAADIPDGARFAEVLMRNSGALPVLLAVQTDTYASREWCRLEVLEAKRRRVPIVVLTAVKEGEARSFPYMGNVPVVRWRNRTSLPRVAAALLREVLRNRYFPRRVEALFKYHGLPPQSEISTYPPELLTALLRRADAAEAGGHLRQLVYPDPPLGTEEVRLIHEFDPDIDPVTPTILLAS